MRHLGVVTLLLIEIIACAPALAAERCPPHEEVGWISSIDIVDGTKPLVRSPRIRRGSDVSMVAEVDRLCVGDHIANPENSNQRITLHLVSEDKLVLPGESFTIPRLTYSDWLAKNQRAFSNFLNQAFDVDTYYKPGKTRSSCPLSPLEEPSTLISFVPDWGPLVLTWPCKPPHSVPFVVHVGGDRTEWQATMVWQNFLRFDISKLCTKICTVHVMDGMQKEILFGFHILVATPSSVKAPTFLLSAGSDTWARSSIIPSFFLV